MKEPEIPELISAAFHSKTFTATNSGSCLVKESDLSLVCVGTPSAPDGSPNLDYIRRVAHDIGLGLKTSKRFHVVVLRCTVPPGTTRNIFQPILEEVSGKKAGVDFGILNNPEFLREGSSVKDFFNPPYTIVGGSDIKAINILKETYSKINSPIHVVSIEESELIKIVNNSFHAMKIAFANEIGRLSQKLELDGNRIMELVCKDTKLNISSAYLKPGFAFGGSCLPKDLRAISYQSRKHNLQLPLLESILQSNSQHIQETLTKIVQSGAKTVTILGLSFKADTDDIRESPSIEIVQKLWRDGIKVRIFDPEVKLSSLTGANLEYALLQLPKLEKILFNELNEALLNSDLAIITKNHPTFTKFENLKNQPIRILNLITYADIIPEKLATQKAA